MKSHLVLLLAVLAAGLPAQAKPLKVFILAGQSNMQGHARVSTFEHIGMDPATAPMLAEMVGPDEQRYKATHQHFRDAMAAPAMLPEFQGNIAVVRTEKYWDRELKLARAKEAQLKEQVKQLAKDGQWKPAEERAALEKLRASKLTERERQILDKGVSQLEFHYLGSAKILGGIGKGFAEAMAELMHQPHPP